MIATAPGKLILTGEYAVLDGAPALVVAVDRRVVATTVSSGVPPPSPFLAAVAHAVAERCGPGSDAARRAQKIAVDSSAFFAHGEKLGLGSSAAVTVAAAALALGSPLDRAAVLAVACAAHAEAQGKKGARGSGADIAAATYGGAIRFVVGQPPAIEKRSWPAGVALVPFFTGASADTASLVALVASARLDRRADIDAALAAIAAASEAALAATTADALLAALRLAGAATDRLAAASRLPIVPPCVVRARDALAPLGGTAKTTGAGGGDIAIGAVPDHARAEARTALVAAGCHLLDLTLDERGVDLREAAA